MLPTKFIGLLFQSRDTMHLAHLATTSFAEHKALDAYYGGILELTDDFVETYFGRFKREEIVIPEAKVMDAVAHLKSMQMLLDSERANYTSELQNIIDEMLQLVNRTLYMLTLN